MRTFTERDYITYPRRFKAYRWYKPLLVAVLFAVFLLISMFGIELITKVIFKTVVSDHGYDDMDFYSAPGAFYNGAMAAIVIPCLIFAALIVKDRPVSSYFSSMGGWRWKNFFRMLGVGFVVFGIPSIIRFALKGNTGIRFTLGGFLILSLFVPLQGVAEEMMYRGFIMQTAGSWFNMSLVGLIVQILCFTLTHNYNIIGVIGIAVSALIYGLTCVFSKGIEAPSALHILNNMTEIYMAGFGFGAVSAVQTVPETLFNLFFKILFFLFVLYAAKKLHWFDEVKRDDVAEFDKKHK
ncbi:MAG: CPBP family intramembrane metalloprotease [Erysipelotrichaceae bacterium]|nr:CPBP family intramembrane metalloprotease [Erysipelotrichaceae bacterium]